MLYILSIASNGTAILYMTVLVSPADADSQSHSTVAALKAASPLSTGVTIHPVGRSSFSTNPDTF